MTRTARIASPWNMGGNVCTYARLACDIFPDMPHPQSFCVCMRKHQKIIPKQWKKRDEFKKSNSWHLIRRIALWSTLFEYYLGYTIILLFTSLAPMYHLEHKIIALFSVSWSEKQSRGPRSEYIIKEEIFPERIIESRALAWDVQMWKPYVEKHLIQVWWEMLGSYFYY